MLPPDDAEVAQLTSTLAERITKFFVGHGMGPESDPAEADPLSREEPWLSGLYSAAVMGRIAYGENAGRRLTRMGDQVDPESLDPSVTPRCASVAGFSLHANIGIPAGDRERLERLIRYCARPAIAMERLESLPDGRLLYRFKRRWRDGTTYVVFQPLELLEKLSALVPAPRAHLVRYSGVLAPAAKWRPLIVPAGSVEDDAEAPNSIAAPLSELAAPRESESLEAFPTQHGRNYSWAELMKRDWSVDVLECPRCFGRMQIVAANHMPFL